MKRVSDDGWRLFKSWSAGLFQGNLCTCRYTDNHYNCIRVFLRHCRTFQPVVRRLVSIITFTFTC